MLIKRIFSACPHDVVIDPEKWQALMDYLCSKNIFLAQFERHQNFSEFARNFARFHLVYAHPLHLIELVGKYGFIPLARYENVYDEAIIVTQKKNDNPTIESVAHSSVALVNGSPSHAAMLIEASDKKIPINYDPILKDNYQDVLLDVALNVAEYGVILKSVWDKMLIMRDRVKPFYITNTEKLFHAFAVSPEFKESAQPIQQALLHLHDNAEGQAILKRLDCKKIISVSLDDVKKLETDISVCIFE